MLQVVENADPSNLSQKKKKGTRNLLSTYGSVSEAVGIQVQFDPGPAVMPPKLSLPLNSNYVRAGFLVMGHLHVATNTET